MSHRMSRRQYTVKRLIPIRLSPIPLGTTRQAPQLPSAREY